MVVQQTADGQVESKKDGSVVVHWLELSLTTGGTTCTYFSNDGCQQKEAGASKCLFHIFCCDILVYRPIMWLTQIGGSPASASYYEKKVELLLRSAFVVDESSEEWIRG